MNIYFVRHGESTSNALERHQKPDDPLSEKGKRQAKIIAKRLVKTDLDFIYASPYLRTQQTAEIISKKLKLKIEFMNYLIERKNPTELAGLDFDDPKAIIIKNEIKRNWLKRNWKYSDGESFEELRTRAQLIIEHLIKKHQDENILCISHGIIIRMIVCFVIYGELLTPEIFWKFNRRTTIENTGITTLKYSDKNGWIVLTLNDSTHL